MAIMLENLLPLETGRVHVVVNDTGLDLVVLFRHLPQYSLLDIGKQVNNQYFETTFNQLKNPVIEYLADRQARFLKRLMRPCTLILERCFYDHDHIQDFSRAEIQKLRGAQLRVTYLNQLTKGQLQILFRDIISQPVFEAMWRHSKITRPYDWLHGFLVKNQILSEEQQLQLLKSLICASRKDASEQDADLAKMLKNLVRGKHLPKCRVIPAKHSQKQLLYSCIQQYRDRYQLFRNIFVQSEQLFLAPAASKNDDSELLQTQILAWTYLTQLFSETLASAAYQFYEFQPSEQFLAAVSFAFGAVATIRNKWSEFTKFDLYGKFKSENFDIPECLLKINSQENGFIVDCENEQSEEELSGIDEVGF